MTFRDILSVNILEENFCLIKICWYSVSFKWRKSLKWKISRLISVRTQDRSNVTHVRSHSNSGWCRNKDVLLALVKYIEWIKNGKSIISAHGIVCCMYVLILRENFRGKHVIFDHDHNYQHVNIIKTSLFKKFKIISKRLFSMCICAYRIELKKNRCNDASVNQIDLGQTMRLIQFLFRRFEIPLFFRPENPMHSKILTHKNSIRQHLIMCALLSLLDALTMQNSSGKWASEKKRLCVRCTCTFGTFESKSTSNTVKIYQWCGSSSMGSMKIVHVNHLLD